MYLAEVSLVEEHIRFHRASCSPTSRFTPRRFNIQLEASHSGVKDVRRGYVVAVCSPQLS